VKELVNEIEQRRAKRALNEENISEEIIDRIMKAATFAPSCFNNQSWRFLVATDDDALKKVHEALSGANYWFKKAPLAVMRSLIADLPLRILCFRPSKKDSMPMPSPDSILTR
jgi:nitroreductase